MPIDNAPRALFPSRSYDVVSFLVSDQPISQQSLSNTTRVSTSAIPIASFSCNVHTFDRRQLQTSEISDGQGGKGGGGAERSTYTRDIVTTHKKPNQLWRGAAWRMVVYQRDDVGWQCASVWPGVARRGVAELSARYITATFGQALWLPSLSLFL